MATQIEIPVYITAFKATYGLSFYFVKTEVFLTYENNFDFEGISNGMPSNFISEAILM